MVSILSSPLSDVLSITFSLSQYSRAHLSANLSQRREIVSTEVSKMPKAEGESFRGAARIDLDKMYASVDLEVL